MIENSIYNEIMLLKKKLGKDLIILAHHYQNDEIVQFADYTGDSFELSKIASKTDARYIVFCGVKFMAEVANILTSENQKVFLPDMEAGCFLADTATEKDVIETWSIITSSIQEEIIPVVYINSSVEIKAFCGENGGIICTSSNAASAIQWALGRGDKVYFLPDRHLGENTALNLGLNASEVYPLTRGFEPDTKRLKKSKIILWDGYCDVHQEFSLANIEKVKNSYSNPIIIVHPECKREVVENSSYSGSTGFIIKKVNELPSGSVIAIGTESNLISRLAEKFKNKKIINLNPSKPTCKTMAMITPEKLRLQLSELANGIFRNAISIPTEIKTKARVAIERMLELE